MRKYGFLLSCIVLMCGLMLSNLAFAQNCALSKKQKKCKQSYVISKIGTASRPSCFEKFDCREVGCDDCIMRMQWRVELKSKDPLCDEHVKSIPDGSTLVADLLYHVRLVGPCQTPVGTHEGKFQIVGPNGNVIGSGKMKGTNGLETHTSSGVTCEDCDAWPHDEGCLDGKIIIRSASTGRPVKCKLIATYSSQHKPSSDNVDICDPRHWTNWTLNIDGIALCKWKPVRPGGKPDLIPVPDPRPGFGFWKVDRQGNLIVTVKNQGTADAGASTLKVEFLPGGTCILPVPPIPAGGSVDVGSCSFPAACFDPDCNFRITVDSNNDVSESNEGNNNANGMCIG